MTTSGEVNTRSGTPAGTPAFQAYGKYVLVRKLAEGGMAEIFLAKQIGAEGFERNVVIKRMLPHLSQMSDFVRMFLDEARLAAQLNHQNIVQINDLGFADGCYYICMEYLAGEDFSTLLRTASGQRQYVPSGVSARVVADAANGLHFAHEFTDGSGRRLKIVHRDVSPSNIFVTYQGGVKVLDFGIVKAEARLTNTSAGVVKGKYMYMSPEQARGMDVDARADIFSLGVSLYEALTNVRPFARDSDLAVLNAVLTGDFKKPREMRPDLSPELERIVLKAMAVKVEDRYQNGAEMALELEQFLGSGGGGTGSAGPAQVASYVQQLFGNERVIIRTRIPTLSALSPGMMPMHERTPTEPGNFSVDVDVVDPKTPESLQRSTSVQRRPRTDTQDGQRLLAQRSSVRPMFIGLLVGGLIAAAAGAGAVRFLKPSTPPPPIAQPAVVNPAVVPLVLNPPLTPPTTHVNPTVGVTGITLPIGPPPSARLDAGVPPPTVATPHPGPGIKPASDEPPSSRTKHPRTAAPIQLGLQDVQKVVSRERASVMACFQDHRDQLSASSGQVTVQFSILSSGKVSGASTQGALSGTPVGRCLEQRVTRMKFPVHKDKQVTLALPFEYRVEH